MAGSVAIAPGPVRAVVFDVGETLIDETRIWTSWADWLGVPRLTFLGALGAAIARGEDHLAPIRLFAPHLDLGAARADRTAAGITDELRTDDLYPDALPCLRALVAAGVRVGVAGNQPGHSERLFRELGVPLDLVASSATLGVEKPDPAFFAAITERLDLPPAAVAYVGDRVDNDIRPAATAGLVAVFIRRGPWAWIQAGRDDPADADLVVQTLAELPSALARIRPERPPSDG